MLSIKMFKVQPDAFDFPIVYIHPALENTQYYVQG